MSEAVHFHVEQQLPELQDLLDKGIFSKDEVRDIVVKRTKFEYKLKRRAAEKSDFLAYISYEKGLEKLRSARVEEGNIKGRHTVSDHSIRQHIYQIYKRATTKFKGDLKIWHEYIDYAIATNGKTVLDRVLASALSLHPTEDSLWIKAAMWEYEGKGNASTARALFQKGVRAVPTSSPLWLSFFRFELDFAARLKERREILGLSDSGKTTDGNVACIVHRYSLAHLPVNDDVQQSFFAVAKEYPQLNGVISALEQNLLAKPDYSEKGSILKFLAAEQLANTDASCIDKEAQLAEILKQFTTSFASIDTSSRVEEAVSFLAALFSRCDEDTRQSIADKIDQIFQVAQETNLLTAPLYVEWIENSKSQALDCQDIVVEGLKAYPNDSQLNYYMASHLLESGERLTLISEVVAKVKTFDESFWTSFMEKLCRSEDILPIMIELFSILPLPVLSRIQWTNCFVQASKASSLPELCEKLLGLRAAGQIIYSHGISAAKETGEADVSLIPKMYAKLRDLAPSDGNVWLESIEYELQCGDLLKAGMLYKKALENVDDVDAFMLDYEELMEAS